MALTTVRFRGNFLPRNTQLSNGLPVAVFPGRYELGTFKMRVYIHLKIGYAPVSPLVLHRVVGGGDHLPLADLICLVFFHKKKKKKISIMVPEIHSFDRLFLCQQSTIGGGLVIGSRFTFSVQNSKTLRGNTTKYLLQPSIVMLSTHKAEHLTFGLRDVV